MGEVWLASRSDGRFEAQCAIKLLDGAVSQEKLAERFRREGRLLARLAHPNIARLLDAGATADGRQFLVLEYVDGDRIDRYCDSQDLDVEARIRLFMDAVLAVAHAHSNLVVHRDLKPSNVLVTRGGAVKLLDFGIAKLIGAQRPEGDDSTRTLVDEIVLTPEYAAPEQLLGELPSTATDVYQLGMLLYVLLIGRHPLTTVGTRADRIRAALSGRVPRASDLATGALRKKLRATSTPFWRQRCTPIRATDIRLPQRCAMSCSGICIASQSSHDSERASTGRASSSLVIVSRSPSRSLRWSAYAPRLRSRSLRRR
jgi:serine/threonine-protein kinase